MSSNVFTLSICYLLAFCSVCLSVCVSAYVCRQRPYLSVYLAHHPSFPLTSHFNSIISHTPVRQHIFPSAFRLTLPYRTFPCPQPYAMPLRCHRGSQELRRYRGRHRRASHFLYRPRESYVDRWVFYTRVCYTFIRAQFLSTPSFSPPRHVPVDKLLIKGCNG